jgi:DNA mismatch repair protein MSH2
MNPCIYLKINAEHPDNTFPPEVIDSGISTMETFFKKWASETREDGEDVIMDDGSDSNTQLEELKKHIEALRPAIESNPWLQSIITTF